MKILQENHIDGLVNVGWLRQTNFLNSDLCHALRDNFYNLQINNQLHAASIGRGTAHHLSQEIRTDRTVWLTGETSAQSEFLSLMDGVRNQLNRELFLGLSSYEAHYASYQAGGFYKKHLDSFKGKRNRIVSTVIYLTPDWKEEDRGHLVLYDPVDQDCEIGRVLPTAGTLACFMSEDIPHEVLPPARERVSIAGWFRLTGSDIINP